MGIYGYTAADLASVQAAKMALIGGQTAIQVTVGGQTIIYQRPKMSDLIALERQIFEDLNGNGTFTNKVRFDRPS